MSGDYFLAVPQVWGHAAVLVVRGVGDRDTPMPRDCLPSVPPYPKCRVRNDAIDVFVQVDSFMLYAAPKSLYKHVAEDTAMPIYANLDACAQ